MAPGGAGRATRTPRTTSGPRAAPCPWEGVASSTGFWYGTLAFLTVLLDAPYRASRALAEGVGDLTARGARLPKGPRAFDQADAFKAEGMRVQLFWRLAGWRDDNTPSDYLDWERSDLQWRPAGWS
jgi:hypothetical protein